MLKHCLTHCGFVEPYMASHTLFTIGIGNGLSPVRCQAITWTNADLLTTEPLEKKTSVKFKSKTYALKSIQ